MYVREEGHLAGSHPMVDGVSSIKPAMLHADGVLYAC